MQSSPFAMRGGFGALVSQAARQWRRAVDQRLQPFGLTEATWLPLIRIARAEAPMRQKVIAESLSLDSSSVVRLLDSLEAAGFVTRKEEDSDRRAKVIVLTERGRATVGTVEEVAAQVREDALAGLSDRDIRIAMRVLTHVSHTLSQAEEQTS
jgi:MarR family transcriptional regulator, transcriptional regulator for hemolysin